MRDEGVARVWGPPDEVPGKDRRSLSWAGGCPPPLAWLLPPVYLLTPISFLFSAMPF